MGMQFTVACNWDPKLVDELNFPEIASLFGGLPDTVISGGRYSGMINSVKPSFVKDYIKKVHEKGWNFDYNINSSCLGNKELSSAGHRQIMDYLESVVDLGIDSLTVSVPNLLSIVKKYFPNIKTKISTFQKIDTVAMARRFEDMGADAIMLSEHVNRDLELLKAIREAVRCKLILIANVGCVYGCPNMHSHANSIAHSGAKGEAKSLNIDTYQVSCALYRLSNPAEFIKIRWIRPEDLHIYEEIGIDMMKIVDRTSSTEALVERTRAYHERAYQGNLINILGQMMNISKGQKPNLKFIFKNTPKRKLAKLGTIAKNMQLSLSELVTLDTQMIPDDFLLEMAKRNCRTTTCETCRYCDAIASQAVKFAADNTQMETVAKLSNLREQLVNGSLLV